MPLDLLKLVSPLRSIGGLLVQMRNAAKDARYRVSAEHSSFTSERQSMWDGLRSAYESFQVYYTDGDTRQLTRLVDDAGAPPDFLADLDLLPASSSVDTDSRLSESERKLWQFCTLLFPSNPSTNDEIAARLREGGRSINVNRSKLAAFWNHSTERWGGKFMRARFPNSRHEILALAWLEYAKAHEIGTAPPDKRFLLELADLYDRTA